MEYVKIFILISFVTLLIVSTINLSTQTKCIEHELQRIDAPKDEEEYEHVLFDGFTKDDTTQEETEQVLPEEPIQQQEVVISNVASTSNNLNALYNSPIRAEIQLEIEQMCAARGVCPSIILSMIYHESRYDEKAIGDNGNSFGLMQIQLSQHEERVSRLGVTDLLDGAQNVIVGIDYLDELLDRYNGDYGAALTAYNQGHYKGTISSYARIIMEGAQKICKE